MKTRPGRRLVIATVVALAGPVLIGCSSAGQVGAASMSAPFSGPALGSNAAVACSRFYEFDLFRLRDVRAAIAGTEREQVRALHELVDRADAVSSAMFSASTIGDLPRSAQVAARKILKPLSNLERAQGSALDLTPRVDRQLSRQSAVIEATCGAAGWATPPENIEARQGG